MSQSTSDILEICLQRVAKGATIDEAVAPYPDQAAELRELLEIAIIASKAPTRRVHVPASAQVDSRKRFLAQAELMQQQHGATYWWGLLHFLRVNIGSLSFGVAILMLFFLAISSVRALPGDRLYAVKLAAEQASISLPGSQADREQRAISFDNQRTEEVARMIQMKRTGQVSFGGFLQTDTNHKGWQIDGIPLQLPQPLDTQAAELAEARVEVKGFLDGQGSVAVELLEPRLDTIEGTLTDVDTESGVWHIESQEVRVTGITQINGTPRPGSQVSVQVADLKDSSAVLAIHAEVKDPTPAPTNTLTPQPASRQGLQTPSEPEDSPTPTATAAQEHKNRSINQPAASATSTPGPSNSSNSGSSGGKDTSSQPQPTSDHHSSDSSGDNSGSSEGDH